MASQEVWFRLHSKFGDGDTEVHRKEGITTIRLLIIQNAIFQQTVLLHQVKSGKAGVFVHLVPSHPLRA